MKTGYTLIELMIIISIISVLTLLGLSAYGKARERQIGTLAGETIISLLSQAQKSASIGKKDCLDVFTGQQVAFARPNIIQTQSLCQNSLGAVTETTLPGITFSADHTIVFNPLTSGVNLGGASPLTISYTTTANLTYSLTLTSSGIIKFLGAQ